MRAALTFRMSVLLLALNPAGLLWRPPPGDIGHQKVADAYLASLTRPPEDNLVSFDKGLIALLHSDAGIAVGISILNKRHRAVASN